MGNALAVKISADVVELQTKFAVARAETNALTAEMNKLARAAAAGNLDAGGTARMQQLAGDMLQARQRTSEFASALQQAGVSAKGFTDTLSTGGVGGALDAIGSKLSTAFKVTGIAAAAEAVRFLASEIVELGGRAAEMRATTGAFIGLATQIETAGSFA